MALVQECDFPQTQTEWLDAPLEEFMRDSVHGRALFSATPMDTGTDWLPNARFAPINTAVHLSHCRQHESNCVFFSVKRPAEELDSSQEAEPLEQDRGTAAICRPHVDLM